MFAQTVEIFCLTEDQMNFVKDIMALIHTDILTLISKLNWSLVMSFMFGY